ncbi:hypothetical protein NPIL_533511, partial [Nephila pilipes]
MAAVSEGSRSQSRGR